jgi:DNA-binding GntR family transcriptional regulator
LETFTPQSGNHFSGRFEMTPNTTLQQGSNTETDPAAAPVSRVARAYQELRDLIIRGRLAPGTRIIEADLASRLGVSRTPVRDALRLLQQEGFVVGSSPSGFKSRLFIAPLTKEDARDLYGIVGSLEGLAARETAQLPGPVRLELARKLTALNDGLREMWQSGRRDPNLFFELDIAFHRTIVEASAGPRLLAMHNSIKPQTERYWRIYASIVDHLGNSVAEHDEILRAIENGDAESAERGIELNWRNGWERLCGVIDTLGERGSW